MPKQENQEKNENNVVSHHLNLVNPKGPSFLSLLGTKKERQFIIEQLSLLLSSGIDILTTLRTIRKEMKAPALKKILQTAEDNIEAGWSISETLEQTHIFSGPVISLIRIGEEAGRLKENLQVIVVQEEKEQLFRSKLISAMMYPLLIMAIAVLIGLGIAWFILPKLAMVFADLKMDLPLITRVLIKIGQILGDYGQIIIPSIIGGLSFILYFLFFFSKTKHIGQAIVFHLPVLGRLVQEVELGRMGYVLGTLISSGIPLIEALNSLAEGTTLRSYQKFYVFLKEHLEEGNTFSDTFDAYKKSKKLIPRSIQQMILAADESGELHSIFSKIGGLYESKTDTTMKNLSTLLEPALLFVVWIGVVGIALAVILPIYSLIGGLNQ